MTQRRGGKVAVYNADVDSREVIRRLREDGWYVHHITGSHH